MSKNNSSARTLVPCFIGYISQAIIINFLPLLFTTLHGQYGIPIEKITFLVTADFLIQLATDIVSSKLICRIGKRAGILLANGLCGVGLIMLSFMAEIMDPYAGIFIASFVYSVGGGLLEVLINPIAEACPVKNKAGLMNLMHSFYCWGVVITVLLSTGFFLLFSLENWKFLACFWAIIPLTNVILFIKAPIYTLPAEKEGKTNFRELFSQKVFWIMLLVLLCAGSAEQAVSQWVSTFTEVGLGVSKTTGDLIAVCGFSLAMGLARFLYSRMSQKIPLLPALIFSGILCVISYLIVSLSSAAVLSVIGCIICGLSVGILWPSIISLSASLVKNPGTTMYSLLALAGDVGCSSGPTVVGLVSSSGGFKLGILVSGIFPVIMVIGFVYLAISERKRRKISK